MAFVGSFDGQGVGGGPGGAQLRMPALSFTGQPAANGPIIDTETDEFMKNLKNLWAQCKKCQALCDMLYLQFSRVDQPFEKALVMVRKSPDYHPSKQTSLAYTVMEQFSNWVCQTGPPVYSTLTPKLKEEAFQVASRQRNKNLSILIADVYKLAEDKELLLPHLHTMLKLHMYKEVCDWAMLLELEDRFTIMEFLLPLILLDKLNVADAFLKKSRRHTLQLIKYLDSLLEQNDAASSVTTFLKETNMPDVNMAALNKFSQRKTLMKIIKKLRSLHNLPDDVAPNCVQRNGISSINFLIHRRYDVAVISKEGFREMVLDVNKAGNLVVARHLIQRLCDLGDNQEARHWIEVYDVPLEELSASAQDLMLGSESAFEDPQAGTDPHCWYNQPQPCTDDHDDGYLQLSISRSQVITIDSEAQFEALIESAVDGASVIGLDCEWKPTMVGKSSSNLSLIQIATDDKVYLLDFIHLEEFGHLWSEFISVCLANPHVMKVGFGLASDLKMMSACLLNGNVKLEGRLGYLDLMVLWARLSKDYKIKLPFHDLGEIHGNGLNQLVAMCLGRPLNKIEQFSNWESRPLRESQITYAALDAHCLLNALEVIRSTCFTCGIPIDDIISEMMSSSRKMTAASASSRKTKKTKKAPIVQPMGQPAVPQSVHSVQFICPDDLAALVPKLRRVGVDVQQLPATTTHEEIAAGLDPERVLLLKPSVYNVVKNSFKYNLLNNNVYIVIAKNAQNQLLEVLNFFNVSVAKEDLFSRCQACNGPEMYQINREDINKGKFGSTPARCNTAPAGEEEYDEDDFWDNDDADYDSGYPSKCDYSAEPEPAIQPDVLCTPKGQLVNLGIIPDWVMDSANDFFACNDCGHVCWDSGYFDEVLGRSLDF